LGGRSPCRPASFLKLLVPFRVFPGQIFSLVGSLFALVSNSFGFFAWEFCPFPSIGGFLSGEKPLFSCRATSSAVQPFWGFVLPSLLIPLFPLFSCHVSPRTLKLGVERSRSLPGSLFFPWWQKKFSVFFSQDCRGILSFFFVRPCRPLSTKERGAAPLLPHVSPLARRSPFPPCSWAPYRPLGAFGL